MIEIIFNKDEKKIIQNPSTVESIAKNIDKSLYKKILGAKVNDLLVDISYEIRSNSKIDFITSEEQTGVDIIRNSTSYLLCHAIFSLFPGSMVYSRNTTNEGFYCDFKTNVHINSEDLEKIERKMHFLIKSGMQVTRAEYSVADAVEALKGREFSYRTEQILNGSLKNVLVYQQGGFSDISYTPHALRNNLLKFFKITKLSGAYRDGDREKEMLCRIHGTCWANEEDLSKHLKDIKDLEKRDHRVIAKRMDLFHTQPEAPGAIFWHPKGWKINRIIREYIRDKVENCGYFEINTPQLLTTKLWEDSGHKAKFSNEMFSFSYDKSDYVIKPMNCPCHVQIFRNKLRSYKELPIRYFEFGSCHRNELSGTLNGLMRVRSMVQDDGHIFCLESHVEKEVLKFIQELHKVYADFGFNKIIYKVATRPKKRVGSDLIWDKAEEALKNALNKSSVQWEILEGEGAFYGPKIEFSLKDSLSRLWQCGTIQIDFSIPEKLEAKYIDSDGSKKYPVILHRAILGSIERFMGILLEHYKGALPLWLAPVQIVVATISENHSNYAELLYKQFRNMGFRVEIDTRNKKIGYKIREHCVSLIPCQIIIGDNEATKELITLRSNNKSVTMSVDAFISKFKEVLNNKTTWENSN